MKPLAILLLLSACATQTPLAVPVYRFAATCPEAAEGPELPRIVTVAKLRENRDATADALRRDVHALEVCTRRLEHAAGIIRELERGR